MKISSYPGMSLRGEVRESISLDEDDLSDVEDEVFIRDGKNGYKLAEELNVKRPLMAPRRKPGKPEIGTRLTSKPPFKVICKPCCYGIAALTILIGLIILVVVLISIYPLPLDWLRDWVIKKSLTSEPGLKLLPCDDLIVTNVWSVNLPKLTTDSAIRTLDVNNDGIEDLLFGFGTGDNYDKLPPNIFCPIFMGVPSPCEGGVIAVNGASGDIIWRHWFNDTIYSLQCSADVNDDHLDDCLAVGEKGTIATLNAQNGSTIWHLNTDRMNIFVASFVPDQDNDTVPDVLASLSSLETDGTGDGHLVLFSGRNGRELRQFKTPGDAKTFYMPQILVQNNTNSFVIFGTGSPSSGGNLSVNSVEGIISGELTKESKTIYEDKFKGMMTQSVLVDITGDSIPDIVTAMFNSSLVAIDGRTFTQIWNFTIPGPPSETNISPTPAFFNYDNITDFLIVYRKYDEIFNSNYTETFIIDGKTGKSIYSPITGSVPTQMSGLVLSFESHGYDMYLFWTQECGNADIMKKVGALKSSSDAYDDCRNHFNTTSILKLNALNQFHQPPGFVIYNSAEREQIEFSGIKSATKQLKEYYRAHPKINIQALGQSEVDENYNGDPSPPKIQKYGLSSFRHKDHNAGLIKSYINAPDNENNNAEDQIQKITDTDYDWEQNQQPPMLNEIRKIKPNFDDYQIDDYNQKHLSMNEDSDISSRDPRSKDHKTKNHTSENISKSRKKDLFGEKNSLYDYRNVRLSRNRLLHDVDYVPTEILKDTFVKNEERRLRKSKFQQRDVNTHTDKIKEKKEIQKIIDKELKESKKMSTTLWDLESEKEMKDWVDGTYRGKRNINYSFISTAKITSVGAVVDSFNMTNGTNSIDLVFIKYWIPTSIGQQEMLKQDIKECIEDKMKETSGDEAVHKYQKTTDAEQRALFEKECVEEQESLKEEFDYFQQLYQLQLGQMTVYRLRVECKCVNMKKNERCVNILPKDKQNWPSYLGRVGDGVFPVRG